MVVRDLEKRPSTLTELMDNFLKHDLVVRVSQYLF